MNDNLSCKRLYDILGNKNSNAPSNALIGTVISINPLKIQLENNIEISEDYIILSALCKERILEYATDWQPSGLSIKQPPLPGDHRHTIEIKYWRGLEVGDKVNVIQTANMQKYLIIDRIGMELSI